jgi:outer membrane autotransporter protein
MYSDIHTVSVLGESFSTRGWDLTASAEAGYRISLGNGYSVTPQGQVIYQRTAIDSGADHYGQIIYDPTNEVYGRLGAKLAKDWITADSRKTTTWADANIWHQFGANAKTTFTNLQGANPTRLLVEPGGRLVGLGISGQLTKSISVFGSGDYSAALNQRGYNWGGRAGVKVTW